jgi:hypothetical protein
MATLSLSTLTNCYYIPSFIPAGSIAIFEQSNCAPTSWVKDTSHSNKALRVVNSTISNGGDQTFDTVLNPSKSLGLETTFNPASFNSNPVSSNVSINPATFTISVGNALANLAPHTHPYTRNNPASRTLGPGLTRQDYFAQQSGDSGGGSVHTHGAPFTSTHNHASPNSHIHPTVSESPHNHPVSISPINFGVLYLDVIFATKS